ncbi:M14 family zinc carboxypeptidase [Streptomyces sp. CA-181903]|uniref:M14 family zinc carboxypeptidase n=1 Tax=Streptomyces sp. CA-181903 TaxID=3240055 RepID=UPI003D942959
MAGISTWTSWSRVCHGTVGVSRDACDETYVGAHAFSEPGSRALRDHILSVRDRLKLLIDTRVSGQAITWPYGYGYGLPPQDCVPPQRRGRWLTARTPSCRPKD